MIVFSVGGCQVVDRFVGAFGVESVDPVEGLDIINTAPGAEWSDQLGLVGADLGLG